MNKDNQPPGSDQATRRKLIKGLGALPAVLTLGSGSAHALASNQECAADIAAGGRNPWEAGSNSLPASSPNTDLGGGSLEAWCETWPTNQTIPPAGYTDMDTLGLKNFDPKAYRDDSNKWVLQYESTLNMGQTNEEDRVCITWFDSASEQLYYTADGDGGDRRWPVTASCYASFVPGSGV